MVQKIEATIKTAGTIRVLSLGAGVQSTALAYLFQQGKIERPPAFAVFADTQREPPAVYENLARIKREIKQFPIIVASKGDLGEQHNTIPFFLKNPDTGKRGMARRQCTNEYKVQVIVQAVRKRLGYQPRQRMRHHIETILGISTDESQRMRESKHRWETLRYPLINEIKWNRADCIAYCKQIGLRPPRSACYFCPYKSDQEWLIMKREAPDMFEKACAFDDGLRDAKSWREEATYRAQKFVHRSLRPLREVEFKHEHQQDLFYGMNNECEGMCGV